MSQGKQPEQAVKDINNPSSSKTAVARLSLKLRSILLALVIGAIVLVAGLMIWQLTKSSDRGPDLPASTTAVVEPAKLGMTVSVVQGEVSHQSAGSGWQQIKSDSQLAEGDAVRTGAGARLVLTLDDGSVIRLAGDTTLQIVSLDDDDVRIEQRAGSVYSRLVPSERQYTVMIGEATYQALGTAFMTVSSATASGVQVYQNAVKTSASSATISQGQQYYSANVNPTLEGKPTSIDVEALVDDEFVKWNLAQDEKDAKFKDKLGVLADVRQLIEQQAKIEAELRRAAAVAAEAEKKADQQAAAEQADRHKTEPQKSRRYEKPLVKRGDMKLWQYGSHLGWGYTGKAIYGFKLVYSSEDSTPQFGNRDSRAVYVSNQYASSYRHFRDRLELERNKTYYIAVCAYTDESQSEACVDYSDVLVVER